jgi:hypothetical protein
VTQPTIFPTSFVYTTIFNTVQQTFINGTFTNLTHPGTETISIPVYLTQSPVAPQVTPSTVGGALGDGSVIALALGIPALLIAGLSLWVAYRQLLVTLRGPEPPCHTQSEGKTPAPDGIEKLAPANDKDSTPHPPARKQPDQSTKSLPAGDTERIESIVEVNEQRQIKSELNVKYWCRRVNHSGRDL